MRQRDDRIEELEEALKESVTITADREMVLAQQTQTISNLQRQVRRAGKSSLCIDERLSLGRLAIYSQSGCCAVDSS